MMKLTIHSIKNISASMTIHRVMTPIPGMSMRRFTVSLIMLQNFEFFWSKRFALMGSYGEQKRNGLIFKRIENGGHSEK